MEPHKPVNSPNFRHFKPTRHSKMTAAVRRKTRGAPGRDIPSHSLKGRHTLWRTCRAGTCSGDMLQRQFSSCDIPVFARTDSVAGTEFCPSNMLHRNSLEGLNSYDHVEGTKRPQCSVSPGVHRSCKLSPLQNSENQ